MVNFLKRFFAPDCLTVRKLLIFYSLDIVFLGVFFILDIFCTVDFSPILGLLIICMFFDSCLLCFWMIFGDKE